MPSAAAMHIRPIKTAGGMLALRPPTSGLAEIANRASALRRRHHRRCRRRHHRRCRRRHHHRYQRQNLRPRWPRPIRHHLHRRSFPTSRRRRPLRHPPPPRPRTQTQAAAAPSTTAEAAIARQTRSTATRRMGGAAPRRLTTTRSPAPHMTASPTSCPALRPRPRHPPPPRHPPQPRLATRHWPHRRPRRRTPQVRLLAATPSSRRCSPIPSPTDPPACLPT